MAETIYGLSESDRAMLREMTAWWRSRRDGGGRYVPAVEDYPAPDVYIALTPSGGIPANPGTGLGDQPNYADCTIYRILPGPPPTITLAGGGFSRRVFNLGAAAIPGLEYVPVARDKWGSWLALSPAGGLSGVGGGGGSVPALVGCRVGTVAPLAVTSQTIASGLVTTYTWDTVDYNQGCSLGSGTITVPTTGYYLIHFEGMTAGNEGGTGHGVLLGTNYTAGLQITHANQPGLFAWIIDDNAASEQLTLSCVAHMNAGDALTCWLSNLSTLGTAASYQVSNYPSNYLEVALLGT